MNPLVSIVMPVYNVDKYLEQALDSLKNQTYKNFEVICVDDGSTDNSLSILKTYSNSDNRFSFIQQANQYAGIARNNGMKHASGKYIMFLDSDDIFEKNMLSVLVKSAEKNHTDIIFFGFYHFKESIKKRSLMGIPFANANVCGPRDHEDDIFRIAQGVPWNKMYLRSFVEKAGLQFQSLQSNNDVFFSKMSAVEAERILFLNKRFVNYRISNTDSLQGSYKLASGNFVKCITAIYHELNNKGKYEIYKKSFEDYVIESYLLTFNKCRDVEGFKIVCDFIRQSFVEMKMDADTPAIKTGQSSKIFENIINGKYEEASFELNVYQRQLSVPKHSVEYRIGKKMLSMFKVKNYD